MKARGKILRDTSLGPGLITVDGSQFPFELEGTWKTDSAPKVDMTVDVEFTPERQVSAIYAVPEAQLAKEQAQRAAEAAKEKSAELLAGMTARFGAPTLIAMAALVIGWFVLNAVSIRVSPQEQLGMTFWKILGVVNSPENLVQALGFGGNAGTGMYGFLAAVALAGPLVPYFWKDGRAHLGGLLPLAFMLIVAVSIYLGIHDGARQAQGAARMFGGQAGAQMAAEMAAEMTRQAMKAISVGLGTYLSLAASGYLAARGAIKFMAARA